MLCSLILSNYASYPVSVRQFRQRSLAYFRYNLAIITLATYFDFRSLNPTHTGLPPCGLSFTFKELLLYLPFKAHTINVFLFRLCCCFIIPKVYGVKQLYCMFFSWWDVTMISLFQTIPIHWVMIIVIKRKITLLCPIFAFFEFRNPAMQLKKTSKV